MEKSTDISVSEKTVIGKHPENPIICWTVVALIGILLLYFGPKQIIPNDTQWGQPGAIWVIWLFLGLLSVIMGFQPFYRYYEVSAHGLTEFRLGRKSALRSIPWSKIQSNELHPYGHCLIVSLTTAPPLEKGNPLIYYYKNREEVLCIYGAKKALDAIKEYCPDDTAKQQKVRCHTNRSSANTEEGSDPQK